MGGVVGGGWEGGGGERWRVVGGGESTPCLPALSSCKFCSKRVWVTLRERTKNTECAVLLLGRPPADHGTQLLHQRGECLWPEGPNEAHRMLVRSGVGKESEGTQRMGDPVGGGRVERPTRGAHLGDSRRGWSQVGKRRKMPRPQAPDRRVRMFGIIANPTLLEMRRADRRAGTRSCVERHWAASLPRAASFPQHLRQST